MDLGWPHAVVASAAVANTDVQDAGLLPGQASAERDVRGGTGVPTTASLPDAAVASARIWPAMASSRSDPLPSAPVVPSASVRSSRVALARSRRTAR